MSPSKTTSSARFQTPGSSPSGGSWKVSNDNLFLHQNFQKHLSCFGYEKINKKIFCQITQGYGRPFLFLGPRGCGKRTLCHRLTVDLLHHFTSVSKEIITQQILTGAHGDFFALNKRPLKVSVEDCRHLNVFLSHHSFHPHGRKIVFLDGLHRWSHYGLNILLKSLEEHAHHVIFFLTCQEKTLPTIMSRCQICFIDPLDSQDFYKALGRYNDTPAFQQYMSHFYESHHVSEKKTLLSSVEQDNIFHEKNSFQDFLTKIFFLSEGAIGKALTWMQSKEKDVLSIFFQWFWNGLQKTPLDLSHRKKLLEHFDTWEELLWVHTKHLIVLLSHCKDHQNQTYHKIFEYVNYTRDEKNFSDDICNHDSKLNNIFDTVPLEQWIGLYESWKKKAFDVKAYNLRADHFFDQVTLALHKIGERL